MDTIQLILENINSKLDLVGSLLKMPTYAKVLPSLLGAIGGAIVAFILVLWRDRYRDPKLTHTDLVNGLSKHFGIKPVEKDGKYFAMKGRLHNTNLYPVTYLVYVKIENETEQRAKYVKLSDESLDIKGWGDCPMIVNKCDIYEFCTVVPWELSRQSIPKQITLIFRDYRNKKAGELDYVPPKGLE